MELISDQIAQLIDLKVEFNKIHMPRVNKEFREMLKLGSAASKWMRNRMYQWLRDRQEARK